MSGEIVTATSDDVAKTINKPLNPNSMDFKIWVQWKGVPGNKMLIEIIPSERVMKQLRCYAQVEEIVNTLTSKIKEILDRHKNDTCGEKSNIEVVGGEVHREAPKDLLYAPSAEETLGVVGQLLNRVGDLEAKVAEMRFGGGDNTKPVTPDPVNLIDSISDLAKRIKTDLTPVAVGDSVVYCAKDQVDDVLAKMQIKQKNSEK